MTGRHDDVGVIFDLDGVLVDTESLYYRAYSAVLAEHGVSVTPETYALEWINRGAGAEYAVRTFGLPMTADDLKARKEPHYARLVATELRAMPGAAACVRRLAAVFPVVLATNARAVHVASAMRLLGVGDCFRDLVTKERFARPKPAPDAFTTAVASLGLPASRCVVIEDAEKGLVAARAAGTRCVIVPCELTRNGDFEAADRVLPSLDAVTPDVLLSVVSGDAPH